MTFRQSHLLGIEPLAPDDIRTLLDLADRYAEANRSGQRPDPVLAGLTQINMFFENSTRTQASFELAGKRLGADVMNMARRHLVGEEGRDPDRHRADPERDAPRPAGRPAPVLGRGQPAGLQGRPARC